MTTRTRVSMSKPHDAPDFTGRAKATVIRAKAPLRVSLGGGGTDVDPFPREHGGCVLSFTIDKYSYCSLIPEKEEGLNVHSLDYNIRTRINNKDELKYDGKLDLVKAALKVMDMDEQLSLFLHSDMQPGSGLGASSTMTVALIGTLSRYKNINLSNYQIADLAYHIEREEAAIKGGRQDQYAASFGGFNFIEFFGDKTIVNPLRIKPDIINELQYRLMLCDTGKRRYSGGIIEDQVAGYMNNKNGVAHALLETKIIALEMKYALLLGQIDEIGRLLNEGWQLKKKFSDKMTDPHINELYDIAIKNGAIGGKLLGAGGGGHLIFLCRFDKRHKIAEELERYGGHVVNFAFDFNGLQTWEV
jgi:D-glycero-alpha-D-manno-heptose-7-phosphate kinase